MFDYPHVVMLYLNMHRIAERFPDTVRLLDADGYLERAWQTARAYFLYPYEILPWYEIYKWGTMNEVVIFDLLAELERRDRVDEAAFLRAELEKKTKYMVYDDRYPFRSEYALDTTGFESTHAIAAWGLRDHDLQPTENLWFDKNEGAWRSSPDASKTDVRDFLDRQIAANIALRGTLEPAYYYLGILEMREGNEEEGRELIRKARQLDPSLPAR